MLERAKCSEDAPPDRRVAELLAELLETVTRYIGRHPGIPWPVLVSAVEDAAEVVKDAAADDVGLGPRATMGRLAEGETIHDGDPIELTSAGETAVLAFRRERRGAA